MIDNHRLLLIQRRILNDNNLRVLSARLTVSSDLSTNAATDHNEYNDEHHATYAVQSERKPKTAG